MGRALLCTILAGLLGFTALSAAPASIPIYQQTVITQPGHYIVTRDIQVASGYAIEIQSDDVTLDLNDHRVISTSITDEVIYLGSSNRVLIRNGQVQGGAYGIQSLSTSGATVGIERVSVSNTQLDGVNLEGVLHLEIVSCAFRDIGTHGIVAYGLDSGTLSGHIMDNSIKKTGFQGMIVTSARGLVIRGNVIADSGDDCLHLEGPPAALGEGGGNLIEGNTCLRDGGSGFYAVGLSLGGHKNRVVGNTFKGYPNSGISIVGDGNLIADNVIKGAALPPSPAGDGIGLYYGQRNLILGNQIEGNVGCGILLHATTGGNAYRDNMLRGNSGGAVCDSGTGNTDAGGNIP